MNYTLQELLTHPTWKNCAFLRAKQNLISYVRNRRKEPNCQNPDRWVDKDTRPLSYLRCKQIKKFFDLEGNIKISKWIDHVFWYFA